MATRKTKPKAAPPVEEVFDDEMLEDDGKKAAEDLADQCFYPRMFPRIARGIHQFAEEEVILPKGPRRGMLFDWDYMPFMRFIADAWADDYWRKIGVVGPVQTGKSLIANNLPMLHTLFELEEDLIVGLPDMELARGLWLEKIKPVIEETKFRELLPTKGMGARGGVPTVFQFKNGVFLRFMGAGGSDAQRSSHTARVVLMTEVDKFDDIGASSEETDPASQIEARAGSFKETSKVLMECTVTHEFGRIWQESMVMGTGSMAYVQCKKCKEYQALEVGQLQYDDTDEMSAEATAKYACAKCGYLWSEEDRLRALDKPVLAHRGQVVARDGSVSGDAPRTRTFGFHYNVLYSPMQPIGMTAAEALRAERSELKSEKKRFVQFALALPWKDEDLDVNICSFAFLRKRAMDSDVKLREVPEWMDYLVMTVDVQKRHMYWHCDAWNRDQTSQVLDYGVIDIADETDAAIEMALNEALDISEEGWDLGATTHRPGIHLVDCGYRSDIIYPWLKGRPGWFGVRGIGRSVSKERRGKITGSKVLFRIPEIVEVRRQTNGLKLWFIEVDNTKSIVHDRYFIEHGKPGHTFVPSDVTRGYLFSITAEQRKYDDNDDGYIWEKIRRRNDFLDDRSYSVAGAIYLSKKLDRDEKRVEKRVESNRKREMGTANKAQKQSFLDPHRKKRKSGFGNSNFINHRGRFFT